MPHAQSKTVYYFDELSESAKARARDWWREGLVEIDWAEPTIGDAVRMGEILGIHIKTHPVKLMGGGTRQDPTVWWQLHVQGSGACFEGSYAYKKGSVKAIKAEAPTDTELHRIAAELYEAQRPANYKLEAHISHSAREVYSRSAEIAVTDAHGEVADEIAEPIREALYDFMDWIYEQLNTEWDYQTSDEVVDEHIRGNQYEFTEEGRRAV